MNAESINKFLEKGFLPSPDLCEEKEEELYSFLKKQKNKNPPFVLNKDVFKALSDGFDFKININWHEFDKSRALLEKGKNNEDYNLFLDLLNYSKDKEVDNPKIRKILEETSKEDPSLEIEKEEVIPNVLVVDSYAENPDKREVEDFVSYFRHRYNFMKDILIKRNELRNCISLSRVMAKQNKETVSMVGLVSEKRVTKKGNILLFLEDPTGSVRIIFSKQNKKTFEEAREIVLDEVVGISGMTGEGFVFANKIFSPDVPLTNEFKKCHEEVYAAFISDVHVGSRLFLRDNLLKFFDWLNGKSMDILGRGIAKKIKYLFVVGDIIDGVGVYPGQRGELEIKDVREQYRVVAELFSKVRKDINIVMCPGQHDALRISEPQPHLDKELAKPLWELDNVVLISNPGLVNIHSSKDFDGFNILMYHGASYHYYIDRVDSLRDKNARDNPGEVLKFLLRKRHLAPSHSSTLYIPYKDKDPLIIDKVPDIYVSGEMHRSGVLSYNNVTLINCSCWQAKTDYQEKTGNNPDPCRVPIMNLKTRAVKIYNFS